MFNLIRTRLGESQNTTIGYFKKVFGEEQFEYINFDTKANTENELYDLNNLLKNKPVKHTLIFLKEMTRCAKTICKIYIIVVYEKYKQKPNDSVIIQGLMGR